MVRGRRDGRWGWGMAAVVLIGLGLLSSGGLGQAMRNDQVAVIGGEHASADTALVLDRVTVIDVKSGARLPDQRVVIEGARIRSIGAGSTIPLPRPARVVDAAGKYLIPGLWDMHSHPDPRYDYRFFLANGITGIRNAWSNERLDTLVRWRREILAGTRIGPPRQLLSVALDENLWCDMRVRDGGGHWCVESGDEDVRHIVDSIKAVGADMVKMYHLSDSMYFLVAAAARRAGLRIGGHTAVPPLAAADSGVGIIDHTTTNAELASACFTGADANIDVCRPLAERFIARGTWWVPTWVMPPRGSSRARADAVYARFDEFVHDFLDDSAAMPASYDTFREHLHRAMAGDYSPARYPDPLAFVKLPFPSRGTMPDTAGYLYVAHNVGLPILAGTDNNGGEQNLAGFSLHAEIATYAAEGLTPLEALQTATLNPAKFLRGTDSLGLVAPGRLADLILLDADPLVDITNTTAIRAVIANGRYFDRSALDRLLAEAKQAYRKRSGH